MEQKLQKNTTKKEKKDNKRKKPFDINLLVTNIVT